MPSGMSGMGPSGSGSQSSGKPPKLPSLDIKNPVNDISSYFIAEGCISGQRFIYSEMNSQILGNTFDFMNRGANQGGLGQAMAKQFNKCGNALLGGNSADAQSCRGQMNEQCSKALDNTCKNTGLYSQLVNLPQSASPYPDACNDALSSYSESSCFSWIIQNLTKVSIIFDYGNFNNLPQLIYNSISANTATTSGRLRYLQEVKTDVTQNDSKATVDGSIKDSDLTIDSATATTVPNPNSYVSNLNTVTDDTSLGASFMNFSVTLFIIVIIGLFF